MAQAQDFKYGTGFPAGSDVADRRLVIDMAKQIGMLNPKETPFFVLLNQAGKMTADQPKFEWTEDEDFRTRSFKADWFVIDDDGDDTKFGYIKLKTPLDLQGLEAPPYQSTRTNYVPGTDIYLKLSDGTNDLYLILEKAGVQNAGKWREIGTGLDLDPATFAATFAAASAADAGYVIAVACAADATFTFQTVANHDDMECHGVNSYTDECVIVGGSSTLGGAVAATAWNTSTADITVTVLTPNAHAGGGFYEGSGLPEESRKGVRLLSNYTQIFKTKLSITKTAMASRWVSGPELARIRRKKGIQHKVDIERALLTNGAKTISTDADSPKRTTQGLGIGQTDKSGFIKTHHPGTATTHAGSTYCVRHVAGTPSANFWTDLDAVAEAVFDDQINGGDSKILFCSQKWLGAFTQNANLTGGNPWGFDPKMGSDLVYGIRVKGYQTAFGRVNIVSAPMLRGDLENYAFFADMSNISLKTLPGRATHLVTNAQTPSDDALVEYYITELGLKLEHEVTHGIIRLVAS